jgi:hypothetical protein
MQQLPPDQRAVLSLVLAQGKGYAEVASALGMSEQSVRERAHAALDALAAQGAALAGGTTDGADDRDERAEQRIVPAGRRLESAKRRADQPAERAEQPSAAPAGDERGSLALGRRGSRTGGALVLTAIAVAAAVAAIVLSGGSGKGTGQQAKQTAAQSKTPAHTTSASKTQGASKVELDKRFVLAAADATSKASGEGIVVSQGSTRAFYVTTQGLPPSSGFFYAVWLYKSQSESWPLGRLPAQATNGRLEGGGPLAVPHLASFHKLVITRETSSHPSSPGPIVMSGPFGLR